MSEQLNEEELAESAEANYTPEENSRASSNSAIRSRTPQKKAWAIQSLLQSDGSVKKLIRATPASWIRNLVWLDGAPFSFTGRNYLLPIYNIQHPRKVLLFSRQTEKSTMLANQIIVNSCIKPYNKSLYVSPSALQTRQFGSAKLSPWMHDSPIISKYFLSTAEIDQAQEKSLANGSLIMLRSAFLNADRVRGCTASEIAIDELQNMLSGNIPVILECQSHEPFPTATFSGTPLSSSNYLQHLFNNSSMNEWLVPCDRHTPAHYNYMDERCIGPLGVICNKCQKPINPANGKWFSFSDTKDVLGFRVCALMVPWQQSASKWSDLLFKQRTYSTASFKNEVLALPHDSASMPITQGELQRICAPNLSYFTHPTAHTNSLTIIGGIDWGSGQDGSERGLTGKLKIASYTILTLGAMITPGKFQILFQRRYTGDNALPRNCVRDILSVCTAFGVKLIGADFGFGFGVNDTIEEVFGADRLIKFQHCSQRERSKYDEIGHKVQLNRTEVMTDMFDDMKMGRYIFPRWEQSQPFLKDVLAIHAEYGGGAGRSGLKYDHKPSEPDDAAHSILFCREAARRYYGEPG